MTKTFRSGVAFKIPPLKRDQVAYLKKVKKAGRMSPEDIKKDKKTYGGPRRKSLRKSRKEQGMSLT